MKLNKFIQFPLVLGIVGTICASALGVVYEITNPIITEILLEKSFSAVKDIVPEMSADSAIITEQFDKARLEEFSISTVYDIRKDGKSYAYGYQAEASGYNKNTNINYVIVISSTEDKVVGLNIVSHSETPGRGDVALANPTFLEQFENATFDELASLPKQDFVVGATVSPSAIKSSVDDIISFHRFDVMGEVDDGIKLNGGERKILSLPEGYTMVNKTDLFFEKLNDKYDSIAAQKFDGKSGAGILNYIQIFDASNNLKGHAYIAEGVANCEGGHNESGFNERLLNDYKFVLMFDENWENSKLVVVFSEDTISNSEAHNSQYPGQSNLINHPWLEKTFTGYSMAEWSLSYNKLVKPTDTIVGATGSTKGLINHIPQIIKYHVFSKIEEVE